MQQRAGRTVLSGVPPPNGGNDRLAKGQRRNLGATAQSPPIRSSEPSAEALEHRQTYKEAGSILCDRPMLCCAESTTAHKHLLTSTCAHAPAHMHLLRCTCSQALAHMHLLTCTCSHALAQMHLLTCTCSHTLAHKHLLTSTCSYALALRRLFTIRFAENRAAGLVSAHFLFTTSARVSASYESNLALTVATGSCHTRKWAGQLCWAAP